MSTETQVCFEPLETSSPVISNYYCIDLKELFYPWLKSLFQLITDGEKFYFHSLVNSIVKTILSLSINH